jgi:hypothetical protein
MFKWVKKLLDECDTIISCWMTAYVFWIIIKTRKRKNALAQLTDA